MLIKELFENDNAIKNGFDTSRIVYHGSPKEFSKFELSQHGSGKTGALTNRGGSPYGIYFTDSKGYAEHFGDTREYYIKLQNPKVYDYSNWKGGPVWNDPFGSEWYAFQEGKGWKDSESNQKFSEYLQSQGYDGIIRKKYIAGIPNPGDRPDEYIVFKPSQVRLVNAKFDPSKIDSDDLLEKINPVQAWGITRSNIFEDSLKRSMQNSRGGGYTDLPQKIAKFLEVKIQNPLSNTYGKHDRPMTGELSGFWHCHLREDAILIYNLVNHCINLVYIVNHSEMEGKELKRTSKKLSPFNLKK